MFTGCNNDAGPDVSEIKVDVQTLRFEKDFFALDTNNLYPGLRALESKYDGFFRDFMINILGLPPISDTSVATLTAVRKFLSDYRPLKDSADKIFASFNTTESEIKKGLQYLKHYFPDYKAPQKIVTFIGPMDAFYEASLGGYGDVLTTDALATGLQLHLGSQFSFYHSPMGQALYPDYISRRFTPGSIPVNCMKNIIDDLYPEKIVGKPLVEQMIEKGKRLYILDKLIPAADDTVKIGYTSNQLKGCYANEGRIWNFFLTNNFLLTNDPAQLKSYLAESPTTAELGEGAPGNIGLFVGWQIVKKYMEKRETISLQQLLKTDARIIFDDSKYRPK
ncbi:MAG: hypothetical protein H7Y31_05650 [Chitinophagaceae bacterium]|nr:hypothetical protein [Chitinophagaceae bacterium]